MLGAMASSKSKAKTNANANAKTNANAKKTKRMKLAEALLLRADVQKRVAGLRERIVANAVVQEGQAPSEDPNTLLLEAAGALADLESLVAGINRANLAAKLPDGRSLTDALARRDRLVQQHALLTAAAAGSRKEPDRYGMREIKWIATMDVKKLQKQLDDMAKELRELNATIQQANWNVEVDG